MKASKSGGVICPLIVSAVNATPTTTWKGTGESDQKSAPVKGIRECTGRQREQHIRPGIGVFWTRATNIAAFGNPTRSHWCA